LVIVTALAVVGVGGEEPPLTDTTAGQPLASAKEGIGRARDVTRLVAASAPGLAGGGIGQALRPAPPRDPLLMPAELLHLAPGTSAAVVDLGAYRMYIYREEAGAVVKVAEYSVSIGENGGHKQVEGDKRTPVGVYFIESYLPGSRLPDLYGAGAFPVNYPNFWDRRLGRTGSGIWVHGTEKGVVSRPPRSSRGCVTVSNPNFEMLYRQVAVGSSAVVFTDTIDWLAPVAVARLQHEVADVFEGWRQAWQSLDTERYLSLYSPDFQSNRGAFPQWAAHKRRVNAKKSFITVSVDHIGMFRYPDDPELVLIDFRQDYRSDDFSSLTHKRQYWHRTAAGWRILHEDAVP
jgi:murein L,D-transpeptidase YafK